MSQPELPPQVKAGFAVSGALDVEGFILMVGA
jgi:hypothetical protein